MSSRSSAMVTSVTPAAQADSASGRAAAGAVINGSFIVS
jgi:hypothetical protein